MERAPGPTLVVLAENHRQMRDSLRAVLEQTPGVRVAAQAGDLALTCQHLAGHRPDVLVLDLNLPDGSSLQALGEIAAQAPDTRVVIVSSEDAPGFRRLALERGASGYVLKDRADTDLPAAVLAAAAGQRFVSGHATIPDAPSERD